MNRVAISRIAVIGLALSFASNIRAASLLGEQDIQWQNMGQLCGTLESITPIKKVIRHPNGKSETLFYSNPFKLRTVVLYKAGKQTAACCEGATKIAETNSDQNGYFAFAGNPGGHYWLVVRLKDGDVAVPLIADNYNEPSCSARNTDRVIYVDAKPTPKVEVHII